MYEFRVFSWNVYLVCLVVHRGSQRILSCIPVIQSYLPQFLHLMQIIVELFAFKVRLKGQGHEILKLL